MEIVTKYFSDFTDIQLQQFAALKELYTEWNEKINVISRKDMNNFYEHHVLHSLAITTQFEFKKGTEIMDLGCGGGFPGAHREGGHRPWCHERLRGSWTVRLPALPATGVHP